MSRTSRHERNVKHDFDKAIDLRNAGVKRFNRRFKPELPAINLVAGKGGLFQPRMRDETSALLGNTHTQGISIGQRDYSILKPGSWELKVNKKAVPSRWQGPMQKTAYDMSRLDKK